MSKELYSKENILERFKSGKPFDTLEDANKCVEILRTEISASIKMIPQEYRMQDREGGGFEYVVGSLVLSLNKFVYSQRRLTLEVEILYNIGKTDAVEVYGDMNEAKARREALNNLGVSYQIERTEVRFKAKKDDAANGS